MSIEQNLNQKGAGQITDRLSPINVTVVTPSDTANLERPGFVALFDAVDTGKVVKVTTLGGGVVSWTLATNEIIPVLVKKVWATGTTAGAVVYICN